MPQGTPQAMSHPATQLPPGFRFHPTDEELIVYYLRNRTEATSPSPSPASIIAEVDIYKFDPWDLPEMAKFGDREWYFFTPRDRKYPNGVRPNRAAVSGYWKATGTDKPISSGKNNVGVKKALVFYRGRPPKGIKTNWIMHEYRLAESQSCNKYTPASMRIADRSMRLDDWVLCRIYNKSCKRPPPLTLIDQEQEDSCTDEVFFPTQNPNQQNSLLYKLPKTSSISDFFEDFSQLSNAFDNHKFDKFNSLFGRPVSSLIQTDDRHSTEVSSESLYSTKKLNESNEFQSYFGPFDNSQYSLLNQPSFSHQLLMNSHLGLQ